MERTSYICTSCRILLPIESFWKSGKYIRYKCKKCLFKYNKKYERKYRKAHPGKRVNYYKEYIRSYSGKIAKMYSQIHTRLKFNKSYKSFSCSFTRKEFNEFIEQSNYKIIHEYWTKSGFDRKLMPSVDRIENSKGYDLNNIRIVTLVENWKHRG